MFQEQRQSMRSWRSNPESHTARPQTPSPSKSTGSNFIINATPVQWKPGNPWQGLYLLGHRPYLMNVCLHWLLRDRSQTLKRERSEYSIHFPLLVLVFLLLCKRRVIDVATATAALLTTKLSQLMSLLHFISNSLIVKVSVQLYEPLYGSLYHS